jgi:hypothetical protein
MMMEKEIPFETMVSFHQITRRQIPEYSPLRPWNQKIPGNLCVYFWTNNVQPSVVGIILTSVHTMLTSDVQTKGTQWTDEMVSKSSQQ